jgi:hypothetical protein
MNTNNMNTNIPNRSNNTSPLSMNSSNRSIDIFDKIGKQNTMSSNTLCNI